MGMATANGFVCVAARNQRCPVFQIAPSPTQSIKNFALKAFRVLGFASGNPPPDQPEPAIAAFPALTWPPAGEPQTSTGRLQAPCGSEVRADISQQDWDILFHAVGHRLRQAVGDRPATAPPPGAADVAGQVQVAVLDGVDCLDLLHAALIAGRVSGIPDPASLR